MNLLTVTTLTRGARPAWLQECAASIDFGDHLVRLSPGDFQEARWATTFGARTKYVAWLDDDDRAMPDALARCVVALETTGAGMAFTNEAKIDADGNRWGGIHTAKRSRRDLAMHPRSIHHLSVFRVAALDPCIKAHADRIGIGIDWLIRAYVGLKHKAVHVPMVGAEWRQHPGQDTRQHEFDEAYEAAMGALRDVTRGWMGPVDAQFPTFGGTAA